MVTLRINDKEIIVEKNLTLLQAVCGVDVQIPRFCFHEKLSIAGNCRMCLVEVLKVTKPVVSCALSVVDNMQVFTDSLLVRKAREGVLELLLINHPLDCPICDQAGECDLQDQTMIYGNDRTRFYEFKRAVFDKLISPLIKMFMTRCIHCTRCIRFLNEIAGVNQLGMTGRGNSSEISTYIENSVLSELSGNIIDLCPVGALTSKPYSFTARPWELTSIENIDISDSMGSNVRFDIRGNNIMRVLPKINNDINEDWITDKTRFSFDGLNSQRISSPIYVFKYDYVYFINDVVISESFRNYIKSSWNEIFQVIREIFFIVNFTFNEASFILGNNVSFETSIFVYIFLMDAMELHYYKYPFPYNHLNFINFINVYNQYSFLNINKNILNNDFISSYSLNISPKFLNSVDVCLLVGTNLRLENPLLNSRLRKSFLMNNTLICLIGPSMEPIYNLKKLGNSMKILISILEGKHSFNLSLKSAISPLILFGSNLKNNLIFDRLNAIKYKFNSNLKVGVVSHFISDLTYNTFFNLREYKYNSNLKLVSPSVKSINYLINCDEIIINDLDKKFIIYQNSMAGRMTEFSDVILPSLNYLEEEVRFYDILGNLKVSSIVLRNPPLLALSSFKILFCLLDEFDNYVVEDDIEPMFVQLRTDLVFNNFDVLLNDNSKYYIKIPNIVLNNTISNFYMTDSVTRSSKVMADISKIRSSKINVNLN